MRLSAACAVLAGALIVPAFAKLPALSDEAKAKAAEAAGKAAWADKVGAYQLCRSMERSAAAYRHGAKAAGKDAPAPEATPPCADPGPFVAQTTTPGTPPAPPSGKATSAETKVPRK